LRHSSTTTRWEATLCATIIHRSWFYTCVQLRRKSDKERVSRTKLLRMTGMPWPTLPSVFATGTRTLSNVTYAVPAVAEYDVLMAFVDTLSSRGIRIVVYPPPPSPFTRSVQSMPQMKRSQRTSVRQPVEK
jgi:hypothetical protein